MFKRVKADKTGTVSLMDVPAKEGQAYERGMVLVMEDGCAVPCVGDNQATYVAYETKTAEEGDSVRCARVADDETYETTLSADGSALKVGDRVTFSADGTEVTATKGDNGAEIVEIINAAKDGRVRVRI